MPQINNIPHVLVVDDDEIDSMYVERELGKLNLPLVLHLAKDGVEALNILIGNDTAKIITPQLIVLDLMMPRMNGLEFLKIIRTHPQFNSIRIFVLTTSNNNKDKFATRNFNVDGYFVKDTQFREFIDNCKKVLCTF